jgi:hypothetical protein
MKMQQTKSYWRFVLALGVVSAFVGAACTVTTSSDPNLGEAGANETAGSPSAGAGVGGSSAGSPSAGSGGTGTAGSGDAMPFECDTGDGGAPPGTPNVCTPDDDHKTDACALCVQANCCTEYSDCYATDPGNQCGWGGPNDEGEIVCVQTCLQKGFADTGVDDADLRAMCYGQCSTTTANMASKECGDLIGTQTNALVGCLSDHCLVECIGG